MIKKYATLIDTDDNTGEPINVYAFDSQWRNDRVGEFIEGGSAQGVVTVNLGNGAKNLENKIKDAEKQLESAKKERKQKQLAAEKAKKELDSVVEKVSKGVRVSLSSACPSLSGKKFQRPEIKKY